MRHNEGISHGAVVLLSVMASVGCTPTPLASTGPQHVQHGEAARVAGDYVPAGTSLSVRIDQALDTQASTPGQRFSAVVQQPLRDQRGDILVPAQARLFGHVEAVNGTRGPRLRLHLETIDTTLGSAPVAARIASSDMSTYAGPPTVYGSPVGYAGWYGPYATPIGGGPSPWGGYGYGGWYGYDIYFPREVHIPAGGVMNLVLTRPIVAPGWHVIR